jgi:hypothetical protein
MRNTFDVDILWIDGRQVRIKFKRKPFRAVELEVQRYTVDFHEIFESFNFASKY